MYFNSGWEEEKEAPLAPCFLILSSTTRSISICGYGGEGGGGEEWLYCWLGGGGEILLIFLFFFLSLPSILPFLFFHLSHISVPSKKFNGVKRKV